MGAAKAAQGVGSLIPKETLLGSKPGILREDVLNPQQQDILSQLNEATGGQLDQLIGGLGSNQIGQNPLFQQASDAISSQLSPFDPEQTGTAFDLNVANPARKAFNDQFIPEVQERYAGGRGGGRGSAADLFAVQGAVDLESNLAGQRSQSLLSAQQQQEQVRQNAVNQALGFSAAPGGQNLSEIDRLLQALGLGFTQTQQIGTSAGSPGLLPSLISAGGAVAGGFIGGPPGAAAGASAGNAIGGAI